MTAEDLLLVVNQGLKQPLTKDDILSDEIKISHLKRIDKVFNKGLHYYLDPNEPEVSKDASIFFRKNKFGTELNMGAKKIVTQFEEFKISLSAISKLAEINTDRSLPVFSVQDNPKAVAMKIRKELYPDFNSVQKEFLRALISKFAEKNILVFEFVETWNKKEKANIDGFFLAPNVIVLKRQQSAFRREIFTLIHELGHYLLNEEEIEQLEISNFANNKLSAIERWCYDFAYYFLAGEYNKAFEQIDEADGTNDYHFELIENISKHTHLSQIALYTNLLYQKKISQNNYNKIRAEFDEEYRQRQEEKEKQKELDKMLGIQKGGSTPKPINSPLLISTIQTAFYEGVINEYDVCKTLNISPDKLEIYLQ
ncbi:MAG: ImmA/IrrE family metallo-endopeptidase [Bacteroidales bacterium]|jgi:Zn-dependent peptidase ImmA (M78 family)|nr:ImmA/IrrE family metallo-endopeptidase [Bacteroidales bacterium]MBP8994940.1 ImmA/IrrE family metallo-endopeptidase [Bacteroidales bacterium]